MGWLSPVIVLLCVVGTHLTKAYPQQNYQTGTGMVQDGPLLDENSGVNFANVFAQSLDKCGAFKHEEVLEFQQIIEVMTKAFGSFPDLPKSPPAVLKATTAGFASAIAERTAQDIQKGELFKKTQCVIQALRKAFVVTTGVTNPHFIAEVERLIEVFHITKGIPDSAIEPPEPTKYKIKYVPQGQPQNQPQGQPQNQPQGQPQNQQQGQPQNQPQGQTKNQQQGQPQY